MNKARIDSLIYEKNVIQKNFKNITLRFGLCYPNVYKTAMSSLGYTLLYDFINTNPDVFCERIIYPNTRSIETNSPLKDFDIISFSLQYEEDYFNVLEILKKAEIPLKREDRGSDDPLIIAGGPCATANPKPMSEFIDLFVIGEGEEVLPSLIDCYLENERNFEKYLDIPGVYVSEYDNSVKIQLVDDLGCAHHLDNPILSDETVFKDSIMLNVSRGCARGCRFCMSSFLYRPVRENKLSDLIEEALKIRENTGRNRITLIGAAVSDYSEIDLLILELEKLGFEISTPSMRLESITYEQLELLRKSNLKTITLAPETISRLRKEINKDVSDEKILEVVGNAFKLGFNVKLYFLVGLPNETIEDVYELIDLMKELAILRKGNSIKFSVNPLIAKPHTPMQWNGYDLSDIKKKMRIIKKELKGLKVKTESPKKGLMQYVLSCGGSEISKLIEKEAFGKVSNKEWQENLPKYSIDDKLPWDNIDVGVSKRFLVREYEKMEKLKTTPWCVEGPCSNCGACK